MLCLLRGCSRFPSNFLRFLPSQTLKKVMIGTSQFTTFIFLDLETTGLRKPVEITELCMVAVERSHMIESTKTKTIPRLIDKLTTCVRPTKEIEPFASSVTYLSKRKGEGKGKRFGACYLQPGAESALVTTYQSSKILRLCERLQK